MNFEVSKLFFLNFNNNPLGYYLYQKVLNKHDFHYIKSNQKHYYSIVLFKKNLFEIVPKMKLTLALLCLSLVVSFYLKNISR